MAWQPRVFSRPTAKPPPKNYCLKNTCPPISAVIKLVKLNAANLILSLRSLNRNWKSHRFATSSFLVRSLDHRAV